MTEHQQSPSNLIVERHYVPRSAPRPTARNRSNISQPREQSQGTNQELVSPGLSSLNSNTPNGYTADNSISEISSLAESVSSMPHLLDPSKLPYHQRFMPESDSGMYSGRARYTGSTTSYGDTDRESIAGESDSRYRGELFQPQAPPRIVQRQVRQMYGEVHPKNLASDDLPTPSSGDELETMSEASIPSFTDAPRVQPRASLRRKKLAEINGGFVSKDDSSIASPIDRSKSMPQSILKSQNTDISDAESLATSGDFQRTASGRTARFEHNEKSRSIPKKVIDYEKLDSADSGSSRKKKGSTSDPFSIVKPVGIKPARNDKRRSSGRSSQRGSQRGSQG
ncbi:serine-rich adhesin for platelets-like [Watersipora subatra]|uniref:serine-rich adhesin for platelets-like n=1 Tax=Watersipora subatra TaxID=2589382 RepID=UPI00355C028A